MQGTLNLNWIRSFEAAARHLSFTEAAAELNVTQAAVSKHVRLLEQAAGEPLFLRLPRRLQLTDVGEAYLHVVRNCLSGLRRGTEEIFAQSQGAGLVTVRCNMGLAIHWLAPRLRAFAAAHPSVTVRLLAVVHGSDAVWEGVDMELRYDSDRGEGFDAHPLTRDALFPVCSPALATAISAPEDILRHPLLHVIGNRRGWSNWFSMCGIDPPGPGRGIQVDTSAIALALAEAGVGVALGHSSLVTDLLATGRLSRPLPQALKALPTFYLIRQSRSSPNPAADLFADWLSDIVDAESGSIDRPGDDRFFG